MIQEPKNILRKELQARVRQFAHKPHASVSLIAQLLLHPRWIRAKTVFLFAPLPSEPDITPLWHASRKGERRFYLPRLSSDHTAISFHEIAHPEALLESPARFLEPPEKAPLFHPDKDSVDLILVPGLGFSPSGARIGRGKGHYDRALSALPDTYKIGVAFDCQIVDTLPEESHDIRMDFILTENRTFELHAF